MNAKIIKHLENIEVSIDDALTLTTCLGVLYEKWAEEDITVVNYTDADFSTQLKNTTMKAAITKLRTMYKSHMRLTPGCFCYKSFIQLIQIVQWFCKNKGYDKLWN